ncbi:hypothetical protein B5X24_HaOG214234 [Helicoverpa armigera]|uniref:Uncharacterized protein n=1 Tax=Helicoverpa armigera TaxID=29058 RepID=A0A2W1B307_HELAM|nr:hypothetical protein B5X24_HaOG214234 [Helicoverpa armigera]
MDTSHVSVVTVGNEEVRVRDSAATHIALGSVSTRLSPDSFESIPSRSQSDSGSVASLSSRAAADADSLAPDTHDSQLNGGTRVNTDSQNLDNGEPVVLRRKQQDGQPVNRIQRSKEDIHMANLKKKTRKRTRKFEIDGVIVTTTTSKVIWGDEESGRTWDDHALRKQELREIKMLQKQEQKQFQDLNAKESQLREQQDKRFEAELVSLGRAHEADLEALARAQRASAERAEQQLEAELRHAAKRLRADHERDLRHFRDTLKQELRLLKQEVELVAKERRKDAYRVRRARLDAEHGERERAFVAALADAGDAVLRRIHDAHRDRQALADTQYLQQRHQTLIHTLSHTPHKHTHLFTHSLDAEHGERERAFVAALADAGDAVLRRIHDAHRDRQALADTQYLQQRHQTLCDTLIHTPTHLTRSLDAEHSECERAFVAALADAGDAVLRRIHDAHRDRQALADTQYLQQRHQIMRTREAALWELEEKQIHERHQLAKRQLKDEFLLRRHQMLVRHDKELEQIKRDVTSSPSGS